MIARPGTVTAIVDLRAGSAPTSSSARVRSLATWMRLATSVVRTASATGDTSPPAGPGAGPCRESGTYRDGFVSDAAAKRYDQELSHGMAEIATALQREDQSG